MHYKEFTREFGKLIKESRKYKCMSLQSLAIRTGIVYDQLQKIESAKHGGVLIETYTKLLSGLDVSLSFSIFDNKNTKLIPVSNEVLEFMNSMFLGLSTDPDLEFLNKRHPLLLKHIGNLLLMKRKALNLTQKQLAKKANISNTTLVHIEGGEHNFRLSTLYKITIALKQ
jgi:transcriptional regulator with XRE-family HTH domain